MFGPVEVFGDANRLHGGDPAYEVNIISPGPERVVLSHLGTPLNTEQTYREQGVVQPQPGLVRSPGGRRPGHSADVALKPPL